jgi:hypothetical protein
MCIQISEFDLLAYQREEESDVMTPDANLLSRSVADLASRIEARSHLLHPFRPDADIAPGRGVWQKRQSLLWTDAVVAPLGAAGAGCVVEPADPPDLAVGPIPGDASISTQALRSALVGASPRRGSK